MRRYLSEFLSDRRVIEWSPLFWQPILQGIVLSVRPKKSGALYASIWNKERNELPLRTFTRAQAEKLAVELAGETEVIVDWAMRYGKPSIAERLGALPDAGAERVLALPALSAIQRHDDGDRERRGLRCAEGDAPAAGAPHRAALSRRAGLYRGARRIDREPLCALDFEPEVLIASYHGLPKSYFEKGDPYHCHCQKTSRLLAERLGWREGRLLTTFQSRFGPEEWLQPYTDKTVERLAGEGVKRLAVINPGFVSDCLETLEEIAVQNREIFLHHGGEHFSHVPVPERFAGRHARHHAGRAARAFRLALTDISGREHGLPRPDEGSMKLPLAISALTCA